MADRTSAALFGSLFNWLASGEPIDPVELWKTMQEGDYDFSPYQMSADPALKNLGLYRKCPKCDESIYGPAPTSCNDCGLEVKAGEFFCYECGVAARMVDNIAKNGTFCCGGCKHFLCLSCGDAAVCPEDRS